MNAKIILVLILLNSLRVESSKRVIDKNLQEFRKSYREFRGRTKLQLDQIYFELYNEVDSRVKLFEEPYQVLSENWSKFCSQNSVIKKASEKVAPKKFDAVCQNVAGLLKSNQQVHVKALEMLFSGNVMKPSPPLDVFDDLLSAFESDLERIWTVYNKNKSCVNRMLNKIIPLFNPYIKQISNLTHATIGEIDVYYKHCNRFHKIAVMYVEKFMNDMSHCSSSECLKEKLLKETECSSNNDCGRLYSSLRSATFSVINTTRILKKNYKVDLEDLADVEDVVEQKVDEWIADVKKVCKLHEKEAKE